MTWEIITGMIALVGAVISVGGIIYKLSQTLTKLNDSVDNLTQTLKNLTIQNDKEHSEMYKTIDEVAIKATKNELCIHDLERDLYVNKNTYC